MRVILGIDAAWTASEPSGCALVVSSGAAWRCLGVVPSYQSFISLADGHRVAWQTDRFVGCVPDARALLNAARKLSGAPVDLVAIDMPVATVSIVGRRAADNCISAAFGRQGCPAHSPSRTRPGPLGEYLSIELEKAGYSIAHAAETAGMRKRLVEVYPHPALLNLLNHPFRVPYKVGKSRRYWPNCTINQRITALLAEFQAINQALIRVLGWNGLTIPNGNDVLTLAWLKRYEDALDALVSAWVGTCYAEGNTVPYGDATAAIWCPRWPLAFEVRKGL